MNSAKMNSGAKIRYTRSYIGTLPGVPFGCFMEKYDCYGHCYPHLVPFTYISSYLIRSKIQSKIWCFESNQNRKIWIHEHLQLTNPFDQKYKIITKNLYISVFRVECVLFCCYITNTHSNMISFGIFPQL